MDITMEEGDALRLSGNPGGAVETLRTHLASPYLAADSTGEKVAFLLRDRGARPAVMDLLGRGVQLFDVKLPLSSIRTFESIYHVTWNPKGNEVAFYNDSGLYLLDTVSGQACQVQLGLAGLGERGRRWAYFAKWSPNGRYLAMITTSGPFPLEFSELTILNAYTGELRSTHPSQLTNSAQYYVTGVSWSPNSRTLAVESVIERKEGTDWAGLFLIDAQNQNFRRILPDFLFGGGEWGQNMAWSPDGKRLVVACPGNVKASLCLTTVNTNP
ncbi:MAG TPA: hypothetical protein ENJ35_02235 [Gammaproteobacteria bacterium]|nr:hypothetical protein [Gammaproteobacteria bacterium]